jgi:hypothetical protein
MRLYELIIFESFDSDVSGRIVRATADHFTIETELAGRKIVFNAAVNIPDEVRRDGDWEIEFIEKKGTKVTYGKTGSGSEMQVFSFVIACIKELTARYHPASISFDSHKKDMNRSKLYQRMVQKIKIPGYHPLEKSQTDTTDTFRIVRDKS